MAVAVTGSGNRPGNPYGLTAAEQAQIAAEVAAAIGPVKGSIAAQRAQYDREQAARQASITAGSAALAKYLQGIAPTVQGIYNTAGEADAHFAKGYSDGLAMTNQGTQGSADKILGLIGAPSSQVSQVDQQVNPAEAAPLLYYSHGYLPAHQLADEGAAFGSAAAMLPGTAALRGQADLSAALGEQTKGDQGYAQQIADLMAKVPGLRQSALSGVLDSRAKARALRDQEIALGIRGQSAANSTRRTTATITGVDPVTGKPTYTASNAAKNRQIRQQQIADAKAAKVTAAKAAKVKATNAAVNKRETAFAKAHNSIYGEALTLHQGHTVSSGDPLAPKKVARLSGQQAYAYLWGRYGRPLLRYASGAGKKQIRARVDNMIRTALISAQYPAASLPPAPYVPQPTTGGYGRKSRG